MNYTAENYAEIVRAIYMHVFEVNEEEMHDQDGKWFHYLSVRKPHVSSSDLPDILGSDIDDCFKARIIEIIFAPASILSPFADGSMKGDSMKKNNVWFYRFLWPPYANVKLDVKVWDFIARILPVCISLSREIGVRQEDIKRGQIESWPLGVYSQVLHFLLLHSDSDMYSEDVMLKLLECWQPHDPIAYDLDECRSGYDPYRNLMLSSASEMIKEKAHEVMWKEVHGQVYDEVSPRMQHESAVLSYVGTLQALGRNDGEIDRGVRMIKLIAQMTERVLAPGIIAHARLYAFDIDRIYVCLGGAHNHELRRWIMRRVLTDDSCLGAGYSVGSYKDYEAASLMISDCIPGEDDDLRKMLEELVWTSKVDQARRLQDQQEKGRPISDAERALR